MGPLLPFLRFGQGSMLVLLTGATGFLGRRVTQALLQRDMEVRCLVPTPGREEVLGDAPVEVYYGDVTDPAALRASMYQVDAVVHLAAIIRAGRGKSVYRVNTEGTRNLASVSRERGVAQLVHMSVVGVRNNPRYPFLRSRWLAEQEVMRSGLPYTIIRSSVLFGEGDEVMNTLAAVVRCLPVAPVPGWGKTLFQPIAVEDAAQCIAGAVGNEAFIGETVEIGGPEHLTYREMLGVIARVCGTRRLWCPVPVPLLRLVAWSMERVLPRPPITSHHLDCLSVDSATELDVVERVFGFSPKRLEEGVQYISRISYWDGWRILLGVMPRHIRDH